MADRKKFLGEAKIDSDLALLLAKAKDTPATEAQLHEQRISFAFGNSPDSKYITKDSMRRASSTIRLIG